MVQNSGVSGEQNFEQSKILEFVASKISNVPEFWFWREIHKNKNSKGRGETSISQMPRRAAGSGWKLLDGGPNAAQGGSAEFENGPGSLSRATAPAHAAVCVFGRCERFLRSPEMHAASLRGRVPRKAAGRASRRSAAGVRASPQLFTVSRVRRGLRLCMHVLCSSLCHPARTWEGMN